MAADPMSYLTQPLEELQRLTIAALEQESGLTFSENTETITEFLSRCLNQNSAWLTKSEGQLLEELNTALGGSSVSHLIYSYARLLDTLNTTIGGGGGPTPLVVADLKNDVYSIGGVSKVFADVLEENTDWESWNPALLIEDVGISVGDTNPFASTGLALTAAAKSGLLPVDGGFTILIYCRVTAPGDGSASITIETSDWPDYIDGWNGGVTDTAGGTVNDKAAFADYNSNASIETPTTGDGALNKVAATLTADHFTISANGNAIVVSDPPSANAAANNIGLAVGTTYTSGSAGTAILERIEFYLPVDDADLPALSTP